MDDLTTDQLQTRNRKRRMLAGLLAAAVLFAAWQAGTYSKPTPPSVAAIATPVQLHVDGRFVAYPGAEVDMGAQLGGTIARVFVNENDNVRKGQRLLELNGDDLRASVREAQARTAQAQADWQLAQSDAARAEQLWQSGLSSAQARERAQHAMETARAALAVAQAAAARLTVELNKTQVTAPIDGTVVARAVQPGETVSVGTRLFTIADLSRTRVEAEVDEYDAGRVRVGDRASIRAEGYIGDGWEGRVEEVPRAVVGRQLNPLDPGRPVDTRILLVKIALTQTTPLKLNQRVQVAITPRP